MKNSFMSVIVASVLASETLAGASVDACRHVRHSAWHQGDFAGRLYRQMANNKDNLAFSPYGVASVCALVGAGAKGETAEAFKNILGEYLKFEGVDDFPSVDLPRLLSDHRAIAEDIVAKVKILPYFSKYLKAGYYPFYREAGDGYLERLGRMVDQVLEVDLPAVENVTVSTVRKIRTMLMNVIGSDHIGGVWSGGVAGIRGGQQLIRLI